MLNQFLDWFDHRTGHRGLVHDTLFELIPSGARFRYITGSMLVFAFVTQVITGLFLWMAYSPSSQTAYESVYYIQHEMTGGWLLRGVHHFMAQAMVVVMALHLLQVVWDGAYRQPREFNHWLGLILLQLVLGLGLTGYLLPWDQKGYWATNVATNLATLVPLVGKDLQQLAVGGNAYGHHTLTRFFAMHAGVLPILLVIVLAGHIALFRRHGITAKITRGRPDEYFWPKQVLFDSIGCLALLAIVLLCVVHFDLGGLVTGRLPDEHRGAELGAPADPSEQYSAARPEWYYLFLFQLLKYFPGSSEIIGALVIPGAVMTIFVLMPFIGYFNIGHRFNQAFTVLVLLAAVGLTGIALAEDYLVPIAAWMKWTPENHPKWLFAARNTNPQRGQGTDNTKPKGEGGAADTNPKRERGTDEAPDLFERKIVASREFLAARQAAEHDAHRVSELINSRETLEDGTISDVRLIPRQGAVYLLRNDPFTRGPRLFNQHCRSCHYHLGEANRSESAKARNPISATDLFGFADRNWIKLLLHPKGITLPTYFGNTAHANGRMATWIKQHEDLLKDDSAKPDDDVDAIAAALSAQAQLPAQHDADAKDADLIRRGIGLIEQNCARGCHRFGDHGQLGLAPDLTGYGSYEWLMGLVSDPTHERFYRLENDRMPSFAKDLAHPERNNLSVRELSLIVDWLRGQYYRADDKLPVLSHTEEEASAAVQLARTTASTSPTIVGAPPPAPETDRQKAQRLFATNCAACHTYTQSESASEGLSSDLRPLTSTPSAPNLYAFASRAWLAGLLDPQQIKSAHYFGNTAHADKEMTEFVKSDLGKLDDEGKAKRQAIIAALSAEAALPSQADDDKKAEADGTLAKGRKAITESFENSACTDCHKFRDSGDLGSAPDLTGWGSKDWLVRFITDPTHDAFYRATNDRMPAFGRSGPGPTKQSLLTPAEIDLLARFLRGEIE
jgi:quinol-cytochrome oxidoreductase complex cytochrome b subunit/mono/diheme cytochrome c family protein